MNVYCDNALIRIIAEEGFSGEKAFMKAGEQQIQIQLSWPSLFEYIEEGALFDGLPKFADQKLYSLIISAMTSGADADFLMQAYDQIFIDCLTEVKALPQIDSAFLINQIKRRKESKAFSNRGDLFVSSLNSHHRVLTENPYHAIHDLTLYIAWERVCINVAVLFEHISDNENFCKSLEVIKGCLVESFQHITDKGQTAPGFFRLMEALYAYQMREERIQTHTDAEWETLCKGSCALKPREVLADALYIDTAIIDIQKNKGNDPLIVYTMDAPDKVKATLSLADLLIEKLKHEVPQWHYAIQSAEIVCITTSENSSLS